MRIDRFFIAGDSFDIGQYVDSIGMWDDFSFDLKPNGSLRLDVNLNGNYVRSVVFDESFDVNGGYAISEDFGRRNEDDEDDYDGKAQRYDVSYTGVIDESSSDASAF